MPSGVSELIRFLRRHAGLLAVLAIGAVLRFGAVSYGLPRHDLGQDELITMGRVVHGPLRSTPGAPAYSWPNLTIHLSRLSIALVRELEQGFGWPRHDEFLIGRLMVATLGTSSLLWLYLAASALFDRRIGVLSAAFLAVMPLHAFRSRLWVPDVPMTTFYALSLLCSVAILKRPTLLRFLAAGAAVGLATAAKYNGAGSCLPVVVATCLSRRQLAEAPRWRTLAGYLAAAGMAAIATFFLVDPQALGNFRQLLAGATWVSELYQTEAARGFLGWYTMRYLALGFWSSGHEGLGPYLTSLALGGLLVLVWRRSSAAVMVWLPALLYLVIFATALETPFERIFLPLLPHLAIGAGIAVTSLTETLDRLLRRRGHTGGAAEVLTVGAVLMALPPVVSQTHAARLGDTRLAAVTWIEGNLPAGARVIKEWNMVPLPSRLFRTDKRTVVLCGMGLTTRQIASRFDYLVLSSASYSWILRQRTRPGFETRVACYEDILAGGDFELVARFAPGPYAFGPEIRIYRTPARRGPRLRAPSTALDLGQSAWTPTERLREQLPGGRVELATPIDLLAGPVFLKRAGRYELSVRVECAEPFPVQLRLGDVSRQFRVRGNRMLALDQELRPGQVWWRIGVGRGFREGDRAVLSAPQLAGPTEE